MTGKLKVHIIMFRHLRKLTSRFKRITTLIFSSVIFFGRPKGNFKDAKNFFTSDIKALLTENLLRFSYIFMLEPYEKIGCLID